MTKTRAIQFRLTKILTSSLFSKIWRPLIKPRPLTQPPKRNQKKSTLVNNSSKRRKKILIKLRPVTGLLSISANHWLRQFKIFNMRLQLLSNPFVYQLFYQARTFKGSQLQAVARLPPFSFLFYIDIIYKPIKGVSMCRLTIAKYW